MTTVRSGTSSDLASITAIYNHYVATSHSTFDVNVLAIEDRVEWMEQFAGDGPHRLLVAEEKDNVLGYACSTPLRPKPAYARSVETTVYVSPESVGRGLGHALYSELLPQLDAAGVHRCYAAVTLPNPASVALHTHHGFRTIGSFTEAGWKFDRWWDIAWYER